MEHPADILAVAVLFMRRYGDFAAKRSREIAENHVAQTSEDASFWTQVAEMVEGLTASAGGSPILKLAAPNSGRRWAARRS